MTGKEEDDRWKAPPCPFLFSHQKTDLQRVRKIHLELVHFTLQIYLHNGSVHHVSDMSLVQDILNRAARFNRSGRTCDSGGSAGEEGVQKLDDRLSSHLICGEGDGSLSVRDEDGDIIVINVDLDPLNTERSFCIPA